jgi:hypothetical protein
MTQQWSFDLAWWIAAVEVPALAALFGLLWKSRREMDETNEETRRFAETAMVQLREALSAYKLEVAKTYASISYIKDVERRLTEHLVRIEAKLDGVHHAPAGGRP